MTLHWADLVFVVAIMAAGCGIGYLFALARLRRVLAENQREMEHRLAALSEAVRSRTTVSDESGTDALAAAELESQPAVSASVEFRASAVDAVPVIDEEEIPLQVQAAITAAAIAALGNHARVRSARSVPSSDMVSPWTQQGRVIVQSSHNLRTQG